MARQGFNGQWIQIAKVGDAVDSKGIKRSLTPDLLNNIVTNFNDGQQAPLTIGHPKAAAPAYGWISELRFADGVLEMKTQDTADEFEQMIKDGRFRTRSAGIWLNHPTLKAPTIDHVAFLGAEAPAVKGLRNIEFSENAEGESFVLEETLNLQEKKMEEKDLDQLPQSFWDKFIAKLGIKTELKEGGTPVTDPATVNLTEAKITEIAKAAAEAVRAEFTEQITELKDENKRLAESIDGQVAGGVHAENVRFVEAIPAEKGKFIFQKIHLAEFLDSLAAADAADAKGEEAICFSEGTGEDAVEYKSSRLDYMKNLIGSMSPIVELGEKFGGLTATADADTMLLPGRAEELREKMGTKKETGGEK